MTNGSIAMDQPQRGKVLNIRDEIKEYKDPKTVAHSPAHQQRLE